MFAAHISSNKTREQSVMEHCRNTSEICALYCKHFNAENLGKLAGLLHDAGKLCSDFDRYIRGDSGFSRGEIDHSYAGARFITETADKEFIGTARLIARVIISHHGLHDWIGENCRDYFKERITNDKNYDEIKSNIEQVISKDELHELLIKADGEYKALRLKIKGIAQKQEEAAFYMGMLERMIESALIDADRTDTASFMSNIDIREESADRKLWQTIRCNMEQKLSGFADRTDPISVQRQSISERCRDFAVNDVRICRLIVPTGGGKTLSSLRFAIEYCIKHGMKRIMYAAPFMSILEQNSAEIRGIVGEDNFIEHHSNALAEKSDDNEELLDYELHTERWDKPVIAATMVQLLNSMFLGKTSSVRRFHRLAKSVMIIDEVQSLPLRCLNMFDLAVNFLSHICGAAVVLCTATQPITDDVRHPMIIDENDSMTGDYSMDFKVFRRTDIIPHIDPYGYSYEEAADFCCQRFEASGNLLVIVNTKAAALNLYSLIKDKCEDKTEVIHLSTNMCPQHRRESIDLIRSLLAEEKPVICVTTQLIEAGVDISFRCVVRSLAGLDNAVQAAGRCNRHGENADTCSVYLIKLKEEKLGSLREISVAQDITQLMAESGKYDDISSPEAVSDYFRMLYSREKDTLSYSVPENETILNYLSLNKNRYEMLPEPKTCSRYESQAFKTAGTLFKVIDDNTHDVLVPYNDEAEQLIRRLESDSEDTALLLRKAQKFMVSVYSGTERKLYDSGALRQLLCGAVVLDKAYYNTEFGVNIDGVEKEVLIF